MATNLNLRKVQTQITYSMKIDKDVYVVKVEDSGRRGGKTITIFEGTLETNQLMTVQNPRLERVLKVFNQLSKV